MSRRCPACETEYPDEVAFCGHDGTVTIEVTPPGEDPDPRLGEKLGDYIVVAHVADGAMGAVYEARQAETRERVAIKVLHPDVEEDEIAVERFRREYETADMLDHPHIVKVLDFGETADRQHFMTMEYLEGAELGHLLRTGGAVDPARILRVLAQVALALEEAHAFGFIHRDLKPDNIFLRRGEDGEDDVRILDFGSVKLQVEMGPKLTAFGTTLGSPFYMSPEQAKGLLDVDNRTDVFALGAILYEALTGKIAFDGQKVAEILMKIVRVDPEPVTSLRADLPVAIDRVVARAVAKDKTDRYDTPVQLVNAALTAFGVEGDCARWASRPRAELQAAMDGGDGGVASVASVASPAIQPQAGPAPAPAAGPAAAGETTTAQPTAAQPTAAQPTAAQPMAARPMAAQPLAPASTSLGAGGSNRALILAGLAVAAALVVGGLLAALLLFLD